MNLADILKQPDGFTPPDVTVTIEKVFARKSGESENGPWSYQDVQVTGGKLKLKGLPEFPSTRIGQTVTIRANQSKQHGLTGMKVAHEEYQNKVYDKLVITSSAKWDWGGNGQVTQPETALATASNAPTNGHSGNGTSAAYIDHVMACAALANQVAGVVQLDDAQAVQACFATICIDTKNRNVLLPRPAGLTVDLPEPQKAQASTFNPEPPDYDPSEDDDIPF